MIHSPSDISYQDGAEGKDGRKLDAMGHMVCRQCHEKLCSSWAGGGGELQVRPLVYFNDISCIYD